MAETPQRREQFAEGVLRFLVYFGFDGFDLDWEYPTKRDGLPEDRENFSELIKVLYKKLRRRNRMLTTAIAASVAVIKEAYNIAEMCQNIDYVNIMGYDMQNMNETSAHAPLRKEMHEGATRETLVCLEEVFVVTEF